MVLDFDQITAEMAPGLAAYLHTSRTQQEGSHRWSRHFTQHVWGREGGVPFPIRMTLIFVFFFHTACQLRQPRAPRRLSSGTRV